MTNHTIIINSFLNLCVEWEFVINTTIVQKTDVLLVDFVLFFLFFFFWLRLINGMKLFTNHYVNLHHQTIIHENLMRIP